MMVDSGKAKVLERDAPEHVDQLFFCLVETDRSPIDVLENAADLLVIHPTDSPVGIRVACRREMVTTR